MSYIFFLQVQKAISYFFNSTADNHSLFRCKSYIEILNRFVFYAAFQALAIFMYSSLS